MEQFDLIEELRKEVIQEDTETEDWPEPIPLDNCSSLPEFPVDALPEPGREMVKVVSEVNQVDPGLTASILLSVLSVSLAKKTEVDLITHKEPLNIYTCSILDSGNRKSGTMGAITKPIYDFQAQKQEEMAVKVKEAMSVHKTRELKLANLQKEAAQADDSIERKRLEIEAVELIKEMSENPVPVFPTYIVDDITTEAQGGLMAENNERIGVFSTEGGIFGIMAGRYNDKNGNFDLYLKAHSGDPWSCHRVGRESKTMQSPALTMCLTIQDNVIEEIGKNTQFKGRGLLARPLYARCKSQVGYRERQLKSLPETLLEQYRKHIFSLMDIALIPRTSKLTEEAQALWDEFYNDIEREMRKGGSLEGLEDWGSKLPGAVARIAGLLHFAEHGHKAEDNPISVTSVTASCVIGAYYKEHAIATFGIMREDPRIKSARKILDYILRHKPDTFKGSEVMRHTNLKTMGDVLPGLEILVEREYIREIEKVYSGKGRPEAAAYGVNPKTKMQKNH